MGLDDENIRLQLDPSSLLARKGEDHGEERKGMPILISDRLGIWKPFSCSSQPNPCFKYIDVATWEKFTQETESIGFF